MEIYALIFVLGLVVGIIFTTIRYTHIVKCLADQNVELFKEWKAAKTREPWEDEGEEWKRGNCQDD